METMLPNSAAPRVTSELRIPLPLSVAVLYTKGQALDGEGTDDLLIVSALEQAGIRATSVDLAHLSVSKQGKFTITSDEGETETAWELPDAVLMYHGALAPNNTAHLLDELARSGCEIVNGRSAWQVMTDKWRFYELMTDAGVPTIPTLLVHNHNDAMRAASRFGWPMVCKVPVGTEGNDVYVVRNERELREQVTKRLPELGGRVIAQPFVESRIDEELEAAILERAGSHAMGMRNDFRIMTVALPGEAPQITAVFQRVAQHPEQAINNVAQGSREVRIEFSDLHPTDQQTVWCALNAMPDAQVVGWDLIGRPGERVIMEANSGPGLPLMPTTEDVELVLGPCVELVKASALRARESRLEPVADPFAPLFPRV